MPALIKRIFIGDNFFKSIKWSPDGKHLLTSSEDQNVYILDPCNGNIIKKHQTFDTIHAISWITNDKYLLLKRNSPLQLWDINHTMSVSYSTKSPLDNDFHSVLSFCSSQEFHHSHLSPPSNIIVTGGKEEMWIFDIETQKEITYWRTRQSKSHKNELSGWISALALRQDLILAAGTFNGHISIYDCRVPHGSSSNNNNSNNNNQTDNSSNGIIPGECLLRCSNLKSGITQLAFDQYDTANGGWDLMVTERKSSILYIYDLRNGLLREQVEMGPAPITNQRFEFDQFRITFPSSSPSPSMTTTTETTTMKGFIRGGPDGNLHISQKGNEELLQMTSTIPICHDAIGGVSFSEINQNIAICTGSRKFPLENVNTTTNTNEECNDYGVYILNF